MVRDSTQKGGWVLLMNCHLAVSWMPELQKLSEELEESIHKVTFYFLTPLGFPLMADLHAIERLPNLSAPEWSQDDS
jgi:hypothetical protein